MRLPNLLAAYRRWRQRRRWRRMTRAGEALTGAIVQLGRETETAVRAIQGFVAWWDSLSEAEQEEMRRLDAPA